MSGSMVGARHIPVNKTHGSCSYRNSDHRIWHGTNTCIYINCDKWYEEK